MSGKNGSWAEALANHATKPRITHNGVDFFFTVDAPVILAEAEELCKAWGRRELASVLEAYPDRDRPGSIDHELARVEHEGYARKVREGAFRMPRGSEWLRFFETVEGKLAVVVAMLRPDHPGITPRHVAALWSAHPAEMKALMDELGNRARVQAEAASAEAT